MQTGLGEGLASGAFPPETGRTPLRMKAIDEALKLLAEMDRKSE